MSFLNITDPRKRDETVKNYLATIKRIQQKNLNEKTQDLARREDLEESLKPVVESTNKSTEAITKELIPIKNALQQQQQQQQQIQGVVDEQQQDDIVQIYYRNYPEKVDKYFGVIVTKPNNRYKMGNTYVQVGDDGANLVIEGKEFKGTEGLWGLIMKKRPSPDQYNAQDLRVYKDILAITNAIEFPNNVTATSRVKSTYKWRKIFPLLEKDDSEEDDLFASAPSDNNSDFEGHGVFHFLPGDIKGLETQLTYSLGEYRAGNKSSRTRNEIVSILDELWRRKRISRREYTDINNFLYL